MASQTLIYFIRHGHSTANARGILAGRDNSIALSPRGEREAQDLAQQLSPISWDQILSSPISRCLQTLEPIRKNSRTQKKPPAFAKDSAFSEMDYGQWSGKKLSLLSKRSQWPQIQQRPSSFTFPQGEGFLEASHRVCEKLLELSRTGEKILVCSHGDIIKLAMVAALGSHIDHFQRIAISPASISAISYSDGAPQILFMNQTSHLISEPARGSSPRDVGGGA
jgi:probable phosphoglycerate mutase